MFQIQVSLPESCIRISSENKNRPLRSASSPCILFGRFLSTDHEPFLAPKNRTWRLPRPFHTHFWSSRLLWKRAGINTLACVTGCTLGGLSTLWFLQSQHPGLGIYAIMGLSSMLWFILSLEKVELILASGVRDRLLSALETLMVRYDLDNSAGEQRSLLPQG